MKDFAFTMAEILLSLTIIGVVAAITLPSLTGNINERTWNTQRKALYARMSQAIALMPALNGYGTLTEDASGSVTEDTAAETFVAAGLSKVLKINNICDNEHLEDCGIPAKFTDLQASIHSSIPKDLQTLNNGLVSYSTASFDGMSVNYKQINTKAVAFETANGESVIVYYKPQCVSNMNETTTYLVQPKICANFIYDLNGTKGPNTIGKDMGTITVLYPTDSVVVAPMPYKNIISGVTAANASRICTQQVGEDYRLASRDEIAAFYVNKNVWWQDDGAWNLVISNTKTGITGSPFWALQLSNGAFQRPFSDSSWSGVCIKR